MRRAALLALLLLAACGHRKSGGGSSAPRPPSLTRYECPASLPCPSVDDVRAQLAAVYGCCGGRYDSVEVVVEAKRRVMGGRR